MLVIVDYGVGNLTSVLNMLKRGGTEAIISNNKDDIMNASLLVLPGMGHFDNCMRKFNNSGLRSAIEKKVFQEKIPLLGICVGLQMMMESSEEGDEQGLGWIVGKTLRFKPEMINSTFKIPHMGWEEVACIKDSRLWQDLDCSRFYFAHSYYVAPTFKDDILLTASHGNEFVAGIEKDNIIGVQFHPRKKPSIWDAIAAKFFSELFLNRIRVIPVLLLHHGGLVKSVRFKDFAYVGDPINAVKIFNDKEIDEIVVLDIDASREKRGPDMKRLKAITGEAFIPLAYGGGISTIEQVKELFYLGVEKVIFNYHSICNPSLISEAAKLVGSQSVVLSVDIKKNWLGKYRVRTLNGRIQTNLDPIAWAKQMTNAGAGEIFLNSIDKDGTYAGYDLDIIKEISVSISVPLIACGGAAGISDFVAAVQAGASAVAAGSYFVFQRPHRAVLISYPSQETLKLKLFSKLNS